MTEGGQGRVALIVLDGVGIGAAPDQVLYGDVGSDTLGNIALRVGGFDLPILEELGLACCRPLAGMTCASPAAAHGVALPSSAGKDSTTGHWELCGVVLQEPFPTYPGGFPQSVVDTFSWLTKRSVLGNRADSGIGIIERLGEEHLATGAWIVYTSVDSVFQVAAHEDLIPPDELYAACELAREEVLVGQHAVSRVIARPFKGHVGSFERTPGRRDFSLEPAGHTLLDKLAAAGVARVGLGKVDDLFAGKNVTSRHPHTNLDTYGAIVEELDAMESGLLFVNVIEFDQTWGHRNDVEGFYRGLQQFDAELPAMMDRLRDDDLMIITADHGNDPTTPSTDHSREAVPVLVIGPRVVPAALGTRRTFADVGATVGEYFHVELDAGESFLREVAPWRTH